MLDEKFLKPYNPQESESRIYKLWEESGFFNPDNLPTTPHTLNPKPFSIIMPPTNANGSLHAGHGLVITIQDILTRYKRMRGHKTLWLPGLDHAGFETQVVYEKQLEKKGLTRFGMDPKKLYREILDFTLENSKNIKAQIKSLGASCDWSREKFTLDPDIVKTVHNTFKKLSDDKLLYRGKRIISWCPKHRTSFSDLEIKDEERIDFLYYLKYGPFTIATSRPETKFGDKFVVMHPKDSRYLKYEHGQKIQLEWINGAITATIIKDEAIDMSFGTGVMTITPWHDVVDFAIAERHNLPKEQIIDEGGKLLPIAGEFAGQHISKARALIVEKLKSKGLLEKIDDKYKHVVRTCYKCGTIIEPQIKEQWFIKMKSLADRALQKIEDGEIKFIPEHYQKIVTHWLQNINDWNISRQIVWGIPIPAKICDACGEGVVDIDDAVTKCPKCGNALRKDSDTFDTWFSSGQWPFAVLGFPDSQDFKDFYPTDVMETAGEIIFFWVARMIMLGLYITGGVPFKFVYLHGLVLDAKGQKMSKSKGNVINPLDLTAQFGTDAFRMGLVVGNTPGTSLSLSADKIKAYKHFANKIWNATRFVLEATDGVLLSDKPKLTETDEKALAELNKLTADVTNDMENFRFYLSAEKIYHFVWHQFADIIIEQAKPTLQGGDETAKLRTKWLLLQILSTSLKLLHPFMPFITEEIWQTMASEEKSLLMVAEWPSA